MPTLADYHSFKGRHWETGSVHNFFAGRGFTAPHTGEPYSEALLLGISGGVVFGYFTFNYEGVDPQCNILTRNTFDPLSTLLSRLGVEQRLEHTRSADRAEKLLAETLEEGVPAIVWADKWCMPYNLLEGEEMWGALPIVVYGYEPEDEIVYIADRARVPLTVTPDQLAAARGRIKKIRHRLLTLGPPDPEKLAAAVRLGLSDTLRLYTEKPPKGSAKNFGLRGLEAWSQSLRREKQRRSWSKLFPAGAGHYAGVTSAFEFAFLYGKGTDEDAERGQYADFLEEAALLLEAPALRDAAQAFRAAGAAWRGLPEILLPAEVAPLGEARTLMRRRHARFLDAGDEALEELRAIDDRLAEIRRAMEGEFPLSDEEVAEHREQIAAHVDQIRAAEEEAVHALRAALS